MTKGIKMAWIIMWHDVSSYLNQSKIRKSKIDKSDLLDTIGPLESVCIGWIDWREYFNQWEHMSL